MLTVYLDESYNQITPRDPNPPLVYTVGGWISTAAEWKKFDKRWHSECRAAGIDWFHMSEYESRLGDYEDWSDAKRVGVLRQLHRLIKDHTLYGVTLSVNCEDFDRIVIGDLKKTFGKTYYSFNVRMLMSVLAEWADKQQIPGPIHYVFAELKGQGNELDAIFRKHLKDPEAKKHFRIQGIWSKGLMKDVRPLQAADIVAYEANKRTVNHIGSGPKFVRASLDNLGRLVYKNRIAPLYFGEQEMLRLIGDAQSKGLRV